MSWTLDQWRTLTSKALDVRTSLADAMELLDEVDNWDNCWVTREIEALREQLELARDMANTIVGASLTLDSWIDLNIAAAPGRQATAPDDIASTVGNEALAAEYTFGYDDGKFDGNRAAYRTVLKTLSLGGMYLPESNEYILGNGLALEDVHKEDDACWQHGCVIHNPTNHCMRHLPTNWRSDRRLMERICKHGVGHPDPDAINYIRRTRGDAEASAASVHGCCGECCEGAYDE